jgi:hypothetical protein
MKITINADFIMQVRDHIKTEWHDQAWWYFNGLPEVEAVIYVFYEYPNADDCEIIREAHEYIESTKGGR